MSIELTVRGDIKVLRLAPGDKVVVEFPDRVPGAAVREVRERLQQMFPFNEVVVIASGELTIVRGT